MRGTSLLSAQYNTFFLEEHRGFNYLWFINTGNNNALCRQTSEISSGRYGRIET
jgi:hypothetical protein